jgi:ParB/RepB/Spo0J family partition protein
MSLCIESTRIDLRYRDFRIRNTQREDRLLLSIKRHGILCPLHTVDSQEQDRHILLDGFKRYHCASKLGIHQLPVVPIASSDVDGLLSIVRHNDRSSLSAFEEACFIDELRNRFGLSLSEISRRVDKSIAWVSVRANMIHTMPQSVREKICSGAFPLRCWMYTLAPFTRVKDGNVEKFVKAVSGNDYSTRDIALLSRSFFSGDSTVREQILGGNRDWTLAMLKNSTSTTNKSRDAPSDNLYQRITICTNVMNQLLQMLLSSDHDCSSNPLESALRRLGTICSEMLKTIETKGGQYEINR